MSQRENLERFVDKCVWEKTGWQKDMSFKEIGAAMERLGAKYKTLQSDIYEYIINHQPDLADWGKLRWLKVTQKRAEYESRQGRRFRATRNQRDFEKKLLEWNIDPARMSLEPDFPDLTEAGKAFSYETLTLTGYTVQPEPDLRRNRVRLQLEDYEIFIYWQTQMVNIEDLRTNNLVAINVAKQEISGFDTTRENTRFEVASAWQGEFIDDHKLQLHIEGQQIHIAFAVAPLAATDELKN